MNIGADLIKGPKAAKLAEAADDINNATSELVDALAEYQDAEGREEREDARELVAEAITSLLDECDAFRAVAQKFDADQEVDG